MRLNQSDVGFTQFCFGVEGEVLLFLEFLTKKCHMSGVVGYYSPRLSFRPLPCKLVIEWRICPKENILFGKICKVQVVCAMKIGASSFTLLQQKQSESIIIFRKLYELGYNVYATLTIPTPFHLGKLEQLIKFSCLNQHLAG